MRPSDQKVPIFRPHRSCQNTCIEHSPFVLCLRRYRCTERTADSKKSTTAQSTNPRKHPKVTKRTVEIRPFLTTAQELKTEEEKNEILAGEGQKSGVTPGGKQIEHYLLESSRAQRKQQSLPQSWQSGKREGAGCVVQSKQYEKLVKNVDRICCTIDMISQKMGLTPTALVQNNETSTKSRRQLEQKIVGQDRKVEYLGVSTAEETAKAGKLRYLCPEGQHKTPQKPKGLCSNKLNYQMCNVLRGAVKR